MKQQSVEGDANIFQQGLNATETGNGFGFGGIVSNGVPEPGLHGQRGTGGGAAFYGYADTTLLPDGNDKSWSATGYLPFSNFDKQPMPLQLNEFQPLVGGR